MPNLKAAFCPRGIGQTDRRSWHRICPSGCLPLWNSLHNVPVTLHVLVAIGEINILLLPTVHYNCGKNAFAFIAIALNYFLRPKIYKYYLPVILHTKQRHAIPFNDVTEKTAFYMNTQLFAVLYQVLNKQVPVPVPVVQVPAQVPVPNLQVTVPVQVLCTNYRHSGRLHCSCTK